jgi:hypothetical protein
MKRSTVRSLAKKTILTQKFSGQDRVQEKEILTQEVDEKTNIAPTQNNWSCVRKEYGHVASRKKQGTRNKEQRTNIKRKTSKQPKKNTMLHDHITYTYEPIVRNRYNQTPAGRNSRLTNRPKTHKSPVPNITEQGRPLS